jgi:hypothetical protein
MAEFTVVTYNVDEAARQTVALEGSGGPNEAELAAAFKGEAEALRKAISSRNKTAPFLTRMLADNLRLRIVLGPDNPVIGRHQELGQAFKEWFDDLDPDKHEERAPRESEGEEAAGAQVGAAIESFASACQQWGIAAS